MRGLIFPLIDLYLETMNGVGFAHDLCFRPYPYHGHGANGMNLSSDHHGPACVTFADWPEGLSVAKHLSFQE